LIALLITVNLFSQVIIKSDPAGKNLYFADFEKAFAGWGVETVSVLESQFECETTQWHEPVQS